MIDNYKYKYKSKYFFNFILILSLYIIWTYKYEIICFKCINKYKKDECLICKNNVIFKNIKIYDEEKTLDEIISKNKSISRYGDGEFKLMFGRDLGFQRYNKEMSDRLYNILNIFNPEARDYYTKWLKNFRFKLAKILKNHEYYSSTITRFYIDLKSKKGVPNYIKKLKKVWDQREVVIIEELMTIGCPVTIPKARKESSCLKIYQ